MRIAPFLTLALVACTTVPTTVPPGRSIGEPVEPRAIVHYAVAQADPAPYIDRTVLVEATVAAVCQNSGCWMQIEDAGHTAMVRWYTDCGGKYAFPKDLAGRRVLVQGAFYRKQLSPDDAEHYSQEAGRELEIALEGYELNATAIVVLD